MTPDRLDHFKLLERLGRGGMAEVRRARDVRSDGIMKDVAIKRVRHDLLGDPDVLKWFRQEAQLTASLDHPNIVHVYTHKLSPDDPYFVMEIIEGVELAALSKKLRENGETLPLDIIKYIIDQVLAALVYIHAHSYYVEGEKQSGVIHRDITPQNIMLSVEGHVKVMDFGIARGEEESTAAVGGKGKRAYMPPEQYATPKEVTSAADMFAVGAVLHELLDGQEFRPEAKVFGQIIEFGYVAPLSCADAIPPELDALRRALLERDQQLRPTAKAAKDRLAKIGVSTSAASGLGELVKEFYNRPRLAPMVGRQDVEQTGRDAGASVSRSTDAGSHTPNEEDDTANSVPRASASYGIQDRDDSHRGILLGAGLTLGMMLLFFGVVVVVEPVEEDTPSIPIPLPPELAPVPPKPPDFPNKPLPVPPEPPVPPPTPPPKVKTNVDPPKKPTKPTLPAAPLPRCSESISSAANQLVEEVYEKCENGQFVLGTDGTLRGNKMTYKVEPPRDACTITLECGG